MRPAYELFVESLTKDLNRVEHYEWREIYERLLMTATKEEKKYLKSEVDNLRYEYTAVSLGKLILGIRDASDEILLTQDNVGLGRGLARQSGQPTPYIPIPTPYIKTSGPQQMELDL